MEIIKKIKPYIKINKNILKFDDNEIEEYIFYQNKSSILINDVGINKIVVFNKLPFSGKDFKYFICYKKINY